MSTSKSMIPLKEKFDRTVVLIDMDCFYCQVEEHLDFKNLNGKKIAVVQYLENAGIIAVNYAARAAGVTRHMREKEAKEVCSDLVCIKVPSKNGKADISKYRDAGLRVANVLEKFTPQLERASVDEAYLDITENVTKRMIDLREKKFSLQPDHLINTYALGYDNFSKFIQDVSSSVEGSFDDDVAEDEKQSYQSSKLRLLIGASIVSEIRRAVKEETGYECSAGIAHNKILAKLVCGMNKPNKQTLLPLNSIPILFQTLEINKIKSMGGKIGEEVCKKLNVKVMAELINFQESELQQHFGPRIGSFLFLISRGIDLEKVERKVMSKSIAVSKNFRGKNKIFNVNGLKFWLLELSKEVKERLDKDAQTTNRLSKQLIVQFTQEINGKDVSSSRTIPLNGNIVNSYSAEQIAEEVFNTIERNTKKLLKSDGKFILNNDIKHLGISAGKFEDNNGSTSGNDIQSLLKNHHKKSPKANIKNKSTTVKTKSEISTFFQKYEHKVPNSLNDDFVETEVNEELEQADNLNQINDIQEDQLNKIQNVQILVSNKFQDELMIRGEKTLKHWLFVLFEELNDKIKTFYKKENQIPEQIKVKWSQIINNEPKMFSEKIPVDIFTNNIIKIELIVTIMKDSSNEFFNKDVIINSISFIEIEAINFTESNGSEWMIKIEGDNNVENSLNDNKDSDTEEINDKSENAYLNETISYSPLSLNNEENDIEMLEQSFMNIAHETKQDIISNSEFDTNEFEEEIKTNDLIDQNISNDKVEIDAEKQCDEKTPTNDVTAIINNKNENVILNKNVAGPSYMQTYAEFSHPPMLDVLNPLEECKECGKMIRRLDMSEHLDHHLALQLSQIERQEFRDQQKQSLKHKKVNTKNQKSTKRKNLNSKTVSASFLNTIEKFAMKPTTKEDMENKIMCEECYKFIECEQFQCHQDFHVAQKIRKEQMQSRVKTKSNEKPRQKRQATQILENSQRTKSLKEYFIE